MKCFVVEENDRITIFMLLLTISKDYFLEYTEMHRYCYTNGVKFH